MNSTQYLHLFLSQHQSSKTKEYQDFLHSFCSHYYFRDWKEAFKWNW